MALKNICDCPPDHPVVCSPNQAAICVTDGRTVTKRECVDPPRLNLSLTWLERRIQFTIWLFDKLDNTSDQESFLVQDDIRFRNRVGLRQSDFDKIFYRERRNGGSNTLQTRTGYVAENGNLVNFYLPKRVVQIVTETYNTLQNNNLLK